MPAEANEVVAYIGLGSNRGDRLANLRDACQRLAAEPDIRIEAHSAVYETESVEGGGTGDFLNAALRIRTSLSAAKLLSILLDVEQQIGRPSPPRLPGPRVIDLDLLLYGAERIDRPGLTVPHPRMLHRRFVLLPLSDVLADSGRVERTDFSLR